MKTLGKTGIVLTGAAAVIIAALTLTPASAKPAPAYTPAYEVVTASGTIPPETEAEANPQVTVRATCPAGTHVTGGGFDWDDPATRNTRVFGSYPDAAGTAWVVDFVGAAAFAVEVRAYAVCATA